MSGAKVVTNAKSPGSRCYGFVTMASPDQATKCIQNLHQTELQGRMVSVERVSSVVYMYSVLSCCCCHPHPSTEKWWRGPTTVSTHTSR